MTSKLHTVKHIPATDTTAAFYAVIDPTGKEVKACFTEKDAKYFAGRLSGKPRGGAPYRPMGTSARAAYGRLSARG